ncbi:MAG: alpha-2-macroglobulin [Chloroflexi bacterium]|nr:alpha-2-macroglobulin [Chloroflexota bacterium]
MTLTRAINVVCLAVWYGFDSGIAQPAGYEPLKAEAEKFYAEGSFARAHEIYLTADTTNLPPAEARWVAFRAADTLWRSRAATQSADATAFDQARQQLEVLIGDRDRPEERDPVWADAQESLGDFHWARRQGRNWSEAWPHYQAALEWWAGAADLELARRRYLRVVWTVARPPQSEDHYFYGYYGNALPLEILENVLKIARAENDLAHAHYLIAMTLRQHGGDGTRMQRVPDEFEAALKPGKTTDWYDDALYFYAEWMAAGGRWVLTEDGQARQEPDYVQALELFRRLIREFNKGETRYYDQAAAQIKNMTAPTLEVAVENVFLPQSEIQFHLNWRNVPRIDLALYAVDLTRHVKLQGQETGSGDWIRKINLAGREKLRSWAKETADKGDFRPGSDAVRLEKKLPIGAYVLEARAEGLSARDLILVTDTALVVKTSGKQALTYVCNALDGSPVPNAAVKVWERYYDGKKWQWRDSSKPAGADGLAVFDLMDTANNVELFVTAAAQDRQAFSVGHSHPYRRVRESWRIYAFADRPAYRPGDTAQWKFIVRQFNGSVYSTPAGQSIEFALHDPRGAKVKEDKATLNAFGSAWGSLELTGKMPLGEYRATFWEAGRRRVIGQATLFRLEEYKLPEFKVAILTPQENGRKKAFRLGDKVEVQIQADYYFGGPVVNAAVELLVYQNPFQHYWSPRREFPWFYEDASAAPSRRRGGQGEIIKRETLKTDATGHALLTFDTPSNLGQDLEYRIEARVTDASRREIVGSDTVRVTRQRYYAYLNPAHHLYRPQDKVVVEVKALDANNQPVQAEGKVKVTRDYWYEIWLDPDGREVKGDELKAVREKNALFPPPPKDPRDRPWQLKFRGYEHDDILTRTVKTDTEGRAEFAFTPEREGYYRAVWTGEDATGRTAARAALIRAETTVWVGTGATTELGYRHGGLELIIDKDTFRAGQNAPVMLSVPTNDRYVLFSIEGEDLRSYQLVHLSGTVKLIEVPIVEKHVPNIFLSGAMVSDSQIFIDTKQVVVPPTQNFLTVEVKPDREQYQPREEGTLVITTRNHEGKPVSAEVALGLTDESVYYIQQDYAGDPRQFFFGNKRQHLIQTHSTFYQKSYRRLIEGKDKVLVDEKEAVARRDQNLYFDDYYSAGNRPEDLKHDGTMNEPLSLGATRVRYDRFAGAGGEGLVMRYGLAKGRMALPMSESAAFPGAPVARVAAPDLADQLGDTSAGPEAVFHVRSDFRSTVLWQPDLVTDADGQATLKVQYPDSLTSWRATARVASQGNQFGIANSSTRTRQPLIVRLQAPRFFVVGDLATVSAVMNNNTDQPMTVQPSIQADGLVISSFFDKGQVVKGQLGPVTIPAQGEARIDWAASAQQPGSARIKVAAKGDRHGDAMEKTYLVHEHGLEKFIARSGKLRGDEVLVKLNLPKEHQADSTTLSVQVTPSLAVTMLDALPYLIDYPYGCTEQTMSRFLPAVVTAKTLRDLGLHAEDVMNRVFGGIEPQHAAQTQPQGKRDLAKLNEMAQQGLDRLYDFQHGDGGWGWWKEGESDHFMSAYVAWGLTMAREAGVGIKADTLERAVNFLAKELVEEETRYDQQAWMLHALAVFHATAKKDQIGEFQTKAFDNLWTNRDKLNAYTRALLALSAHHFGFADKAKVLVENLENGVKTDNAPDTSVLISPSGSTSQASTSNPEPSTLNSQPSTALSAAHWGEDGISWRWSEGGVEATSFVLRALLAIDPQNKLIEPVTHWLIKNRRGAQWSNTRDTAITVLALNDYLRQSRELAADLEFELLVNGHSVARKKITGADALSAPSLFEVDRKLIRDGPNEIRLMRKAGTSPVYFAVQARFFSLEEPVTPAGHEIFVRRQYYKWVGRPTLLKGYIYDRQPLHDGETVKSGERVEVLLTIEAKNNYEYLVFEDLKPAGLEAAQVRSGQSLYAQELRSSAVTRQFSTNAPLAGRRVRENAADESTHAVTRAATAAIRDPQSAVDFTGRTRWVYQELRDRKVALFIDKLPEGVWEIRYDLRAEVPGQFHALPVLGHAMYVPELRCNSDEVRLRVQDTP